MVQLPRLLLAAPASGSGKTMITCGILQLLSDMGKRPTAFKCGPDFIDPMFHRTVLGIPSYNLDPFFTKEEWTRALMAHHSKSADLAVVEGVMGYYDGLAGVSTKASAYDTARITGTPAILIVDCRGMSTSIPALIRGFLSHREDSGIKGVILNRISGMLYPGIRDLIERELPVQVCGYVPQSDYMRLESRHLGLVLPDEVKNLRERVRQLAAQLSQTLDTGRILSIAEQAPPLADEPLPDLPESRVLTAGKSVRIAVARDEAFCFLYEDNLELLRRSGAELVFFSPLHDRVLPQSDGLILCGGYPELYLEGLSLNESMRAQIRDAVRGGLPTMAECGGFMYLQEEMEDPEGNCFPAAGAIPGRAWKQQKAGRFGYITMTPRPGGMAEACWKEAFPIRGHEFHYYESSCCGREVLAEKPVSGRTWECMTATESLLAGYPHLYYYSNPEIVVCFLKKCVSWRCKA